MGRGETLLAYNISSISTTVWNVALRLSTLSSYAPLQRRKSRARICSSNIVLWVWCEKVWRVGKGRRKFFCCDHAVVPCVAVKTVCFWWHKGLLSGSTAVAHSTQPATGTSPTATDSSNFLRLPAEIQESEDPAALSYGTLELRGDGKRGDIIGLQHFIY